MPRRSVGRLSATPVLLALTLTGVLAACDARDQEPQQAEAVTGRIAPETLEPSNLERWADETFGRLLEEHRISALAISVTHGDDVLFKKGYGYHDYATMRPVDADVSQFRIGSLTKTFFGTAIAQLLERGEIESLDDPVNRYLTRIQLENPFGDDEITIRDMVTHQGGMVPRGSRSPFTSVGEERPRPPLSAAVLEANLPPVVREPGTFSDYCNACSAVMGFMVEDITGQTLEEYLRENVYEPLGMTHTTLVNSLQAPSADVVTQYAFVSGEAPVALRYPSLTPFISYAGDINSTAGDMARFIRAHALQGSGSTPTLMAPETYGIMHRWDRGNHPDASGFGIQFFRYEYNGEPVIEHYGSIRYRSLEIIMLDAQVGVFVTMAGGGEPNPGDMAAADSSVEPVGGPVLAQEAGGVRRPAGWRRRPARFWRRRRTAASGPSCSSTSSGGCRSTRIRRSMSAGTPASITAYPRTRPKRRGVPAASWRTAVTEDSSSTGSGPTVRRDPTRSPSMAGCPWRPGSGMPTATCSRGRATGPCACSRTSTPAAS